LSYAASAAFAVTEDVLDVNHPNQDEPGSNQRRREQQAEKSGEHAEDDLCRQCQRRRQVHGPALHQWHRNVALDKMNPEIEPNYIGGEHQVDRSSDDDAGYRRSDAAEIRDKGHDAGKKAECYGPATYSVRTGETSRASSSSSTVGIAHSCATILVRRLVVLCQYIRSSTSQTSSF